MKHDAQNYSEFRPFFPKDLFTSFWSELSHARPARIGDIACGGGQSTLPMAEAGRALAPNPFEIFAYDSDPAMIERLKDLLPSSPSLPIQAQVASAEDLPLADQSLDGIVCLSAYHWLDRKRANTEWLRVLKKKGVILVGEYQFPKSPRNREINEWIRRQFNTLWKLEQQRPRGTLKELLIELTGHPRVRRLSWDKTSTTLAFDPLQLSGLIQSQARFIAYADSLKTDEARASELRRVQENLEALFRGATEPFEFQFHWALMTLT